MIPEPNAGLDMGSGASTKSPRNLFFFSFGTGTSLGCPGSVVCDELWGVFAESVGCDPPSPPCAGACRQINRVNATNSKRFFTRQGLRSEHRLLISSHRLGPNKIVVTNIRFPHPILLIPDARSIVWQASVGHTRATSREAKRWLNLKIVEPLLSMHCQYC